MKPPHYEEARDLHSLFDIVLEGLLVFIAVATAILSVVGLIYHDFKLWALQEILCIAALIAGGVVMKRLCAYAYHFNEIFGAVLYGSLCLAVMGVPFAEYLVLALCGRGIFFSP